MGSGRFHCANRLGYVTFFVNNISLLRTHHCVQQSQQLFMVILAGIETQPDTVISFSCSMANGGNFSLVDTEFFSLIGLRRPELLHRARQCPRI